MAAPIPITPTIVGANAEPERADANARAPGISTKVHLRRCRSSRRQRDSRRGGEEKSFHGVLLFMVAKR
jgi:hypothetical protein